MKRIKINRNFFWGKRKAEVMQTYNLSEEEYYFIHSKGLQRDENHKVLEEWVVEIPDNLEGSANPQKTPSVQGSSISPKNQQYGFAQNVQPFIVPQPVCSQQTQYHSLAQQWMNQSLMFMQEVKQRKNTPGYTEEQCKADIQQANWYMQMIDKCMNAAAHTQFNQVTTVMNYGGSSSYVTAINTPMADRYMTIDMIGKGIDLFGKLADSIAKLANAVGAIANFIAMFKGGKKSN